MNRRRTRYIATGVTKLGQGQAHDDVFVMAYSKDNAVSTLLAHGIECQRCEPYKRAVKREAPYRIDRKALTEAIEFHGLTLPVRIRFTSKAGSTAGNYRPGAPNGRGENFHNIMLKDYVGAEQASITLWHELTHAMQFEREAAAAGVAVTDPEARRAWRTCAARGRGIGYSRKPIEVEAREGEAMHDALPLAV